MIERIMSPDRTRANPMGSKGFDGTSFFSREYRGGAFQGVKTSSGREYRAREFLGIRNAWIGRPIYSTRAARELSRYVLGDAFPVEKVRAGADREASRTAADNGRADREASRPFLGRGKSQDFLDQNEATVVRTHPAPAPMTIDQVRDLLNRNR